MKWWHMLGTVLSYFISLSGSAIFILSNEIRFRNKPREREAGFLPIDSCFCRSTSLFSLPLSNYPGKFGGSEFRSSICPESERFEMIIAPFPVCSEMLTSSTILSNGISTDLFPPGEFHSEHRWLIFPQNGIANSAAAWLDHRIADFSAFTLSYFMDFLFVDLPAGISVRIVEWLNVRDRFSDVSMWMYTILTWIRFVENCALYDVHFKHYQSPHLRNFIGNAHHQLQHSGTEDLIEFSLPSNTTLLEAEFQRRLKNLRPDSSDPKNQTAQQQRRVITS